MKKKGYLYLFIIIILVFIISLSLSKNEISGVTVDEVKINITPVNNVLEIIDNLRTKSKDVNKQFLLELVFVQFYLNYNIITRDLKSDSDVAMYLTISRKVNAFVYGNILKVYSYKYADEYYFSVHIDDKLCLKSSIFILDEPKNIISFNENTNFNLIPKIDFKYK